MLFARAEVPAGVRALVVLGAASSSFADRAVLDVTAAAAVAAFLVVRERADEGFASASDPAALPSGLAALLSDSAALLSGLAALDAAVDFLAALDAAVDFFAAVAADFFDVVAGFRAAAVAGFFAAPVDFFALDGRRAGGFDSTVSTASSRGAPGTEPGCSSGTGFSGD